MTEEERSPKAEGRRLSRGSRFWLIVTAVLLVLAPVSLFLASQPPDAEGQFKARAFDLQGHRGARGLMPENSLPAFEAALALGVTTLELDTVMTADGVVVVHHDRRLMPERTRDAAGNWLEEEDAAPLIGLTRSELAAYDIGRARPGSRVAQRYPEQQGLDGVAIPTLAEVLARAEALSGGQIRYNIETKISPLSPDDSAEPAALADALVAAIRAAGVAGRAAVQSFDWRSLLRVQEMAPDIETVYLTAEQSWLDTLGRGARAPSPWIGGLAIDWSEVTPPAAVKAAGGAVWSPYYRDLKEQDLREAQALGLRVVVWTVNDPGDMASLIDLGVDGIITDYPDRARRVMEQKEMPLPPAFPAN
ncbi:glycerophosphodiester phosphodiesterase [Pelagibius sp.]|uniref:glycerophosphodiester phosphodiesterase n=1 Tax=Pelagibius sp. TaxID=1931238 RepID=UPI0026016B96|nr:glycerophosphodiester phosphodiesterase [Pelagibius sp.]